MHPNINLFLNGTFTIITKWNSICKSRLLRKIIVRHHCMSFLCWGMSWLCWGVPNYFWLLFWKENTSNNFLLDICQRCVCIWQIYVKSPTFWRIFAHHSASFDGFFAAAFGFVLWLWEFLYSSWWVILWLLIYKFKSCI